MSRAVAAPAALSQSRRLTVDAPQRESNTPLQGTDAGGHAFLRRTFRGPRGDRVCRCSRRVRRGGQAAFGDHCYLFAGRRVSWPTANQVSAAAAFFMRNRPNGGRAAASTPAAGRAGSGNKTNKLNARKDTGRGAQARAGAALAAGAYSQIPYFVVTSSFRFPHERRTNETNPQWGSGPKIATLVIKLRVRAVCRSDCIEPFKV
ncbi:hypothetical protein EVAR_102007_1 [Eumeta japonica]|uniref:Uncharacterized protein n=1 Tax=Eumeta variegata TaxID=151549 RepID=A0A4C2AAF6_EUMVA|nr:hypothetical protein EVAR_102007_1 [Eumeta japonica]